MDPYQQSSELVYRKTIACLPPSEQIIIYFEKIKVASQKLNLSIFGF